MSTYTTLILDTGEYIDRQRKANEIGAVCYFEQHLNADGDRETDFSLGLVAANGSSKSEDWAVGYAHLANGSIALAMGLPDRAGWSNRAARKGRGDANLRYTAMPAIIGEPGFLSSPEFEEWANSNPGQRCLSLAVVQSVVSAFPEGGLVALSIGHLGKPSAPNDRGAVGHGGVTEVDIAEPVIRLAAKLLEAL